MYQNIVVAVDLGDTTEKLIEKAKQLEGTSSKLTVLYVLESLESMYVGDDWMGGAVNVVALQQDIKQQRETQIKKLTENSGIPAEHIVLREGSPAVEIKEYAKEVNADVVVIGTHGRHGLELLLGSISNGVLHGTPCDVLAVKV